MSRYVWTLCFIAVLAFTGICSAVEPILLFADDFSEDAVGGRPGRWNVGGNTGHIEVVEDPGAVGGKAVRIVGDDRRATQIAVTLASEHPIVIVEHRLRYVRGFGLNYWIDYAGEQPFGPHNVNWFPRDGELLYTHREGGRTVYKSVGTLYDGWNDIRVVADWEKQQAYVELNGVDKLGPVPLWNVIDGEWNQIRVTFYDTGRWSERSGIVQTESYYDDIKIMAVPWEQADEYRRILEGAPSVSYEPIWIEYPEVAGRPPEWWTTDEARALADRIVCYFRQGVFYMDIPVQLLNVPDGIMSTQLLILAHAYAATGQVRYKNAFQQGIETLLEAQFPSGLWPTTYPNDKDQDLIKDKFSADSWVGIPALFHSIIAKEPPFDTDIVAGIDSERLQNALARIPPKASIVPFRFADYAQKPALWWESEEARQIGDNLLSWQMDHGGWERIIGMAAIPFSEGHIYRGTPFSDGIERGDFLSGRTTEPLRFMARLFSVTGDERYLESFYRGLEFILAAQYDSGGWPRHYPIVGNNPERSPFNNAVTFYYDAMVTTMEFIQDILDRKPPFEFVDDAYMPRLELAFAKGIEFILKAQIEVDGRLTAWAQRYNPVTLQPQAGRAFEPVAINPWVSVGIIRLLQSLPAPSADVRRAILSALEWLEEHQLPDGRWAMFYEIGTNRPIFAGRDGIIRYDLSEIELERQLGYVWYGTWPQQLLDDARRSGYMDELYVSLPDHPTIRVRFASVRDGERVSGILPVDVELLHEAKAKDIARISIDIDGEVIYSGTVFPDQGELQINTEKLDDGRHVMTVTTEHKEYGTFQQSVTINVQNWWRLVQNMAPPVTQGWFGTIDFLETSSRSDGWAYETGDSSLFFGDPQRLVRSTDATEYLTWETHRLQTVNLVLFVRPGTDLRKGVVLETSPNGIEWEQAVYEPIIEGDGAQWQRAAISLDLANGPDAHWFRLTLTSDLPKEAVQIGEAIFMGYREPSAH